MVLDLTHLRQWIGREHEAAEVITPRLANALDAVLDGGSVLRDGDIAPVGIHWCITPDVVPMHLLGDDGHPSRGDFLPPVPLPRRMWAGGHLDFFGAFRVGATIRRSSRVEDVTAKEGASGSLCFVAVKHEYSDRRGLILRERHNIVYREASVIRVARQDGKPSQIATETFEVEASTTLLQRYSAATLNSHRIHYDRDYCVRVEDYPALVVHGPLQATFLLAMAVRLSDGQLPRQFGYRAVRPLFDGKSFSVNGAKVDDQADLWITSCADAITMSATALWVSF